MRSHVSVRGSVCVRACVPLRVCNLIKKSMSTEENNIVFAFIEYDIIPNLEFTELYLLKLTICGLF